MRLGTLLKARQKISSTRLMRALDRQKLSGGKLGRILVDQGMITEEDLVLALHHQWQVPVIDLAKAPYKPELVQLWTRQFAVEHLVLPITIIQVPRGGVLVVAMENPADRVLILELHEKTGYPIKPMLAGRNALLAAIMQAYSD